jgi:hypothetical protein
VSSGSPSIARADSREAEVELDQTRAAFAELGCTAWLSDLDNALAGDPA